jgi:DNA-binding transcriptional regulator YbjK
VELFPAEQLAQALANLADRNATVAATLDRLLSVGGNAELLMVALSFAYAVADNHGLTGTPLAAVADAAA